MTSSIGANPTSSNSSASLEGIAADIRAHKQTTSRSVFAIGTLLQTAKDMVSHGEFSVWARSQCGLSLRSVQRYMQAARRLEGKYDTASLLQPGTIYALTAKGVDDTLLHTILNQGNDRPLQDEDVLSLLANARTRVQRGPTSVQDGRKKLEHAWVAFFGTWNAADIDDMREFCRVHYADIKEWLLSAAMVAEQPPLSPEGILRQVLSVPNDAGGALEETVHDEGATSHERPDAPSPSDATSIERHPLDIPECLRRTA